MLNGSVKEKARCRKPLVITAFLVSSIACVELAEADSFRCGRKVVRTGDSPADLVRSCGEPRFKDKAYENMRLSGRQEKIRVDRWYYKISSRRLEKIVLIHKGRIVAVQTGQR